jgi:hypothetical protein
VAIDSAPAPTTLTISAPLAFAHPAGAPAVRVMFAQFQRDFDADGVVTVIGDLAAAAGAVFTFGGTPGAPARYQGRFDLNYNNSIGVIDDLSAVAGAAFLAC